MTDSSTEGTEEKPESANALYGKIAFLCVLRELSDKYSPCFLRVSA